MGVNVNVLGTVRTVASFLPERAICARSTIGARVEGIVMHAVIGPVKIKPYRAEKALSMIAEARRVPGPLMSARWQAARHIVIATEPSGMKCGLRGAARRVNRCRRWSPSVRDELAPCSTVIHRVPPR